MRNIINKLAVFVLFFVFTNSALAAPTRFSVVSLQPAVDNTDYFTIYASQTLQQWDAHAGFYFDYSNSPLTYTIATPAGVPDEIVEQVLTAHLFGALGVTDWLSVGVNVPVSYIWLFSDSPQAAPSGNANKGLASPDVTLDAKVKILDSSKSKFGLAVVPQVTIPLGDSAHYLGNGSLAGGGKIVADYTISDNLNFAVNLGAQFREQVIRNQVTVDDSVTGGIGGSFKFLNSWNAIAEINSATQISDPFNTDTTPVEFNAGVRHWFKEDVLALDLAGSMGIMDAVASPNWRVFSGLRYNFKRTPAAPVAVVTPPVVDNRIQDNKITTWGKIQYDTNKATIKPESLPILDDVADVLIKNPDILLVQVEGHTDARGTDANNLKLSDARANAAMEYLISKGIASTRLQAQGFGETKPIADNTTTQGMEQNRRTEFVIVNRAPAQADVKK